MRLLGTRSGRSSEWADDTTAEDLATIRQLSSMQVAAPRCHATLGRG